jgi:DNA-binding NarL/FixJ family response regulator
MDKIQVVIVDDHPLFREGVVMSLAAHQDIIVVGQGANGDEALQLARDFLPDILLLDIGIPGGGIATAQAIASACPATKIIMLTGSENEDYLVAALRVGARAYVLKGVSARELVTIVRNVAGGDVYVTPAMAHSLLFDKNRYPPTGLLPTSPADELTARERQILELVAEGFSNKEVGQKLFLSEKTVKHYMTNILQKLQVRNRVEATLIALKSGYQTKKD